jgi:hypothetical protein
MAADEQQSRDPRTSRLLTAQLMSPRLGTAKIVVRNISASGLGGKCDQILYKGEEVAVLLANVGAIDATVVWAKDRAFGLHFDERIDPALALAPPTERVVQPYEVPAYFRPDLSTYRPGFKRKK